MRVCMRVDPQYSPSPSPPPPSLEVILRVDQGMTRTVMGWGEGMMRRYHKRRAPADINVQVRHTDVCMHLCMYVCMDMDVCVGWMNECMSE